MRGWPAIAIMAFALLHIPSYCEAKYIVHFNSFYLLVDSSFTLRTSLVSDDSGGRWELKPASPNYYITFRKADGTVLFLTGNAEKKVFLSSSLNPSLSVWKVTTPSRTQGYSTFSIPALDDQKLKINQDGNIELGASEENSTYWLIVE